MLPFLLAAASYSADSLGDIYEDTAHAATSYRADTRKLSNPCLAEPFSSMPFCNAFCGTDKHARNRMSGTLIAAESCGSRFPVFT